MLFRGPVTSYRNFSRFLAANNLPGHLIYPKEVLPEIDLMICAVEKDFSNLEECISQATKHSANPISSVSIIVPAHQIDLCRSRISKFALSLEYGVEVIDEDSLISQKSRMRLKESLGSAYGWGLQQFLTVAFVIQSKSKGVLAVNADTLLLRSRTWLRSNGCQELLVSSEYHSPYYKVLNKIDKELSRVDFTFICHQMLFQPELLRIFLSKLGVTSIDDFVDITLSNADCSVRSPFCVEFEFYAQSMYRYKRSKIELVRFANVPYKFVNNKTGITEQLDKLEKQSKFNSVSQHSWLVN
jgi:hypothetical protein